ncbi:tRNA A64-2'-O-ribosylphosphate transferase [Tolypocladium ophioglossoides CBS 100239]|uniref:tRNA A64-2'-O-ribosylphosphate transferase n=1 Tax=Tolypocladium ophioglossoides (strain CBS 100239) TaxID=1163406 RepID=A0A0L0NHP3_TOLOC|nr:tRNA A64-2'-O-ribosylphosphate transferase [Tolypocladium ophioglossoides CBS 100239]
MPRADETPQRHRRRLDPPWKTQASSRCLSPTNRGHANPRLGMPDALSTTIPIWCTVLNLVLLPSHPLSPALFLPPHLLPSTHAQIAALIPSFVAALRALDLALPTGLTKPLRPLWVTPDSVLEREDGENGVLFDEYRPVICCTASRRVVGSEMDERGYVQGAGDDTENWACGLTPGVFWAHVDELLAAPEADLPDLIAQLFAQHECSKKDASPASRVQLTPQISVCHLPLNPPTTPTTCHIALTTASTPKDTWLKSPTYLEAGLGKSKTASRNLRTALPQICAFAAGFLEKGVSSGDSPAQVVVACDSGKDVSVGAALALSCYLFDDGGRFRVPGEDVSFTKTLVKVRLRGVMTAYPEANPSRQTLQSVNSFLMDWRR